jgi:hypothetical protein
MPQPKPSQATLARAELQARALTDAVLVDCLRACTRSEPGAKLPRRVLLRSLQQLYRLQPTAPQLDAAVAVAHQDVLPGYMAQKGDRRRAFVGLAMVPKPGMPSSIYAVWNQRLKKQGLKVGQLKQFVDVFKAARGEGATDRATAYLRANDWAKWPPEDEQIFEAWYLAGKTTPGIARALDLKRTYVWSRLAVHQQRAGVAAPAALDAPVEEVTAQPTGGSLAGGVADAEDEDQERVAGFLVSKWGE